MTHHLGYIHGMNRLQRTAFWHQQAFSLVELSIVLVILGLLTGGILGGQSLIRAAELRTVSADYARFVTATQTFRDKYFALPGDMSNATSFWGAAHATPATCVTTTTNDARTCNGNGDGMIVPSTGSAEHTRYWQQLANAGLIEGTYTGINSDTSNPSISPRVNAPAGRISSSGWHAWYWGLQAGSASRFALTYDNAYYFGSVPANSWPSGAIMKPEELWNIDTKMDDGKPAQGKVIAHLVSTCTTTNDGNVLTADYLLSSTATGCGAIFRQLY
ncbi:MAG: hypothetical protein DI582_01490 [Azospirillum brasilense]|nr:MAG: hypothetical protein DI582_01490 [Azospirillum brasilense]